MQRREGEDGAWLPPRGGAGGRHAPQLEVGLGTTGRPRVSRPATGAAAGARHSPAGGAALGKAVDAMLRFPSATRHDPAIDRWLSDQRDDLRPFVEQWFAHMRKCG